MTQWFSERGFPGYSFSAFGWPSLADRISDFLLRVIKFSQNPFTNYMLNVLWITILLTKCFFQQNPCNHRTYGHRRPLFLGSASCGGCSRVLRLVWVPSLQLPGPFPCCVRFWREPNYKWLACVLGTLATDSAIPGSAPGGRALTGLGVWRTHCKALGSS